MKLKKVKYGLHRRLATGLLVSVSMMVPATLLAGPRVEHASIVPIASHGNSEIAPWTVSLSSSSQRDEDTASDEVRADRPAWAGLFDVETNSGLPSLDSDHRRESSSGTASAERFDSERKRLAGKRVARGTYSGLRLLQRILSNGQDRR